MSATNFQEDAKRFATRLGLLLFIESADEWRVHLPGSGKYAGTVRPRTKRYTRNGRVHVAEWAAALRAIAGEAGAVPAPAA